LTLNPDEVELDFEVIKEPWNKYNLTDGSNLKLRYVLTKVRRKMAEKSKPSYALKSQNVVESYNVPINLLGPPAKVPLSPDELKSAAKQEIGFTTLFEEWAEYLVEDGTRIRVKVSLLEVFRTEKTNPDGEPIYIANHSMTLTVKPSKTLISQR
jgi:hypothetical protein